MDNGSKRKWTRFLVIAAAAIGGAGPAPARDARLWSSGSVGALSDRVAAEMTSLTTALGKGHVRRNRLRTVSKHLRDDLSPRSRLCSDVSADEESRSTLKNLRGALSQSRAQGTADFVEAADELLGIVDRRLELLDLGAQKACPARWLGVCRAAESVRLKIALVREDTSTTDWTVYFLDREPTPLKFSAVGGYRDDTWTFTLGKLATLTGDFAYAPATDTQAFSGRLTLHTGAPFTLDCALPRSRPIGGTP